MDKHEMILEEFRALRTEVDSTKSRAVKTVWLGLTTVPVLTFISELPNVHFLGPLIPFVVLVLTVLFVSEEHALMRCGRYIRERIEPLVESGAGWESWLESQPQLRQMDRYFFGCFLLTFFVFYAGSVGVAITRLWSNDDFGTTGDVKAMAGGVVYAIGAIWMIFTMLHHWRSFTSTSA